MRRGRRAALVRACLLLFLQFLVCVHGAVPCPCPPWALAPCPRARGRCWEQLGAPGPEKHRRTRFASGSRSEEVPKLCAGTTACRAPPCCRSLALSPVLGDLDPTPPPPNAVPSPFPRVLQAGPWTWRDGARHEPPPSRSPAAQVPPSREVAWARLAGAGTRAKSTGRARSGHARCLP